ncbi:hypothetical protein [Catenovulum agarivorans]|uniref:hypothetical protein n=1 Tax=Catenovulum agarivorans TaxID=1172192 RepID=UPI0002D4FA58|nr:hypothetical protein [Catenovulum agarivorans]
MAYEIGGMADKLGNRYEGTRVAYQLLRLLHEQILSVEVETIGNKEEGVDIVIENNDHSEIYEQCKGSNGGQEQWRLSDLKSQKILDKSYKQILTNNAEYHLVSPLNSKNLYDLCTSARNFDYSGEHFLNHLDKKSQSKKLLIQLCEHFAQANNQHADYDEILLFLKKFRIEIFQESITQESHLEFMAKQLISGNIDNFINTLKNYPSDHEKLRTKLTFKALKAHLELLGFKFKLIPEDSRIVPKVEKLQTSFKQSIEPFLITNELIKRDELEELSAKIRDFPIILVEADSGVGKSAFLYEFVNQEVLNGSLCLPVRLDRQKPDSNSEEYGRKLGLPTSPVFSLKAVSKSQRCVLVLDQLDALRWGAMHSRRALEICMELVDDALHFRKEGFDISVVIACRKFDAQDDKSISAWLKSLSSNLGKVSLSKLPVDKVKEIVSTYEQFENLSAAQQDVLRTPLWLSIYVIIAKDQGSAPCFNSKLELVSRYWDTKVSEFDDISLTSNAVMSFVNLLVDKMSLKGELSIPERMFSNEHKTSIYALQSAGVILLQNKRISFRHQSLYDFKVGESVFRYALEDTNKVLSYLSRDTENNKNYLARREHLKYALIMLFEYDELQALKLISALLSDEKVRYLAKFVAIQSLRNVVNKSDYLVSLITRLFNSIKWRNNFLSHVAKHNNCVLGILAEINLVRDSLACEQSADEMISFLKSISETNPNFVVNHLKPYFNASKDWNDRINWALNWRIEKDSDEMFTFRKTLMSIGIAPHDIYWEELVKHKPEHALELIELLLGLNKDELTTTKTEYTYSHNTLLSQQQKHWSEDEFKEVLSLASRIPEKVVQTLFPIVIDYIKGATNSFQSLTWLSYRSYIADNGDRLATGVIELIIEAFKTLKNKYVALNSNIEMQLESDSIVVNYLIANYFYTLPESELNANKVLMWLLQNPSLRFSCGNNDLENPYNLAGRLIEKYSNLCSDSVYEELEKTIFDYKVTFDLEHVKRILESNKKCCDNRYIYSYWGFAQHQLIPRLPKKRISAKCASLHLALIRKLGEPDFSIKKKFDRSMASFVRSPIKDPFSLSLKAL